MPRQGILMAAFMLLCVRAWAQSVISAHAGLVHYFEGAISIDGQTVPAINGRFAEIAEGSVLNTNAGRAEILLGPEVFLWLAPYSAIRMQRSGLADARVELLEGSAVIQSVQLPADNAITLIQKDSQVRVSAHSLYHVDASLSELTVRNGEAGVTSGRENLVLNAPSSIALSSGLMTPLAKPEPGELEQWAQERQRAIAAANLARASMEDSGNSTKKRPRRRSRAFPAVMAPVPRRTW